MNCKEFVWGFQTWGSLFLAETLDWLQTCIPSQGTCAIYWMLLPRTVPYPEINSTCAIIHHFWEASDFIEYWTGTTVQYSGKLESQKSSYSLNTRKMKQQEKYSLVTTLGHHFTKQKRSFSQLIFCFLYSFMLPALNWLHLWFLYGFETKKYSTISARAPLFTNLHNNFLIHTPELYY